MKLLILTQAVDLDDPVLRFFHRWIEEFAKHAERVHVVALRAGRYQLPHNVHVASLGKERAGHGQGFADTTMYRSVFKRFLYTARLCRFAWLLRKEYDAVFVHMNPEYLIAAGWLWWLLGKKAGLWYAHGAVGVRLRLGAPFADVIFTPSKESFRLPSKKVHVVGHGIDTEFWTPDARVPRGAHLLSVGRLMPRKRHDRAIEIAAAEGRKLHIAGNGPERASLESIARASGAVVTLLGPLSQEALREEYRRAHALLHTSETGSLDKVVLEAIACGCPVRTEDPALKHMESKSAAYVREHHSLSALIPRIIRILS